MEETTTHQQQMENSGANRVLTDGKGRQFSDVMISKLLHVPPKCMSITIKTTQKQKAAHIQQLHLPTALAFLFKTLFGSLWFTTQVGTRKIIYRSKQWLWG